jgi:branched-subunit amino acid aminotransferase/4-amino-4-deoxychorismate lyase
MFISQTNYFFVIINNTLITPPASTVLEGITRKMVIKLAKENSIEFQRFSKRCG